MQSESRDLREVGSANYEQLTGDCQQNRSQPLVLSLHAQFLSHFCCQILKASILSLTDMPSQRDRIAANEIDILAVLSEKRQRDAALQCDEGMSTKDILNAINSLRKHVDPRRRDDTVGSKICNLALTALIKKGYILENQVERRRRAFKVNDQGEARLAEFRKLQESGFQESRPKVCDEQRPADDDPGAIIWLAVKYADTMFPGKDGDSPFRR